MYLLPHAHTFSYVSCALCYRNIWSTSYEMSSCPLALCSGHTSHRPREWCCSVSTLTCCTPGASRWTLWIVPKTWLKGKEKKKIIYECALLSKRGTNAASVKLGYPYVDHSIGSVTLHRIQLEVSLKVAGVQPWDGQAIPITSLKRNEAEFIQTRSETAEQLASPWQRQSIQWNKVTGCGFSLEHRGKLQQCFLFW